jgi:hypothetical protein
MLAYGWERGTAEKYDRALPLYIEDVTGQSDRIRSVQGADEASVRTFRMPGVQEAAYASLQG